MLDFIVKNIPNLITISRLLFTYLIYLLLPQLELSRINIFILYLISCFTDFLDGYVARKFKLTTDFGKFFDGFIDYVVTSIIAILFYYFKVIDIKIFIWFAIIIIRDTIRNVIRINRMINYKKDSNNSLSASNVGKISRVIQNVILGLVILFPGNKIIILKLVLSKIATVTSVISFWII